MSASCGIAAFAPSRSSDSGSAFFFFFFLASGSANSSSRSTSGVVRPVRSGVVTVIAASMGAGLPKDGAVRVRLEGQDHFINRLGRFDDPVARARAQAISAEIWSDYQQGTLDWSLSRYKPLVSGQDPELLKALEELMLRKRQGRTTHAYRVLRRYGGALRSEGEVSAFLRWMEAEGLAAATRSTILSTIRSVQPANKALTSTVIKVPHRSVQEELLSKGEIQKVLKDLFVNEECQ